MTLLSLFMEERQEAIKSGRTALTCRNAAHVDVIEGAWGKEESGVQGLSLRPFPVSGGLVLPAQQVTGRGSTKTVKSPASAAGKLKLCSQSASQIPRS